MSLETALENLGIDPRHAAEGWRATHPFPVAVRLAMRGFRVMPSNRLKIPMVRQWQLNAATAPGVLARWQARMSPPCWSILTGRANAVIVLDIDGARGREDLARLESKLGPLPPRTVRVITGRVDRGEQIWLRPPPGTDDLKNQQPIPGFKLDVRGWHGHAVIPGSLHKSGTRYAFAPGCAPDEIGGEIPECPPEWWAWLPKKEAGSETMRSRSPTVRRAGGVVHERHHDPASHLIGDGNGFGGFQDPIYKNAIRYFLNAGADAPPEIIIATLRELIDAAPKDPGRDVTRYMDGPDLPRIVERARDFVFKVKEQQSDEYDSD